MPCRFNPLFDIQRIVSPGSRLVRLTLPRSIDATVPAASSVSATGLRSALAHHSPAPPSGQRDQHLLPGSATRGLCLTNLQQKGSGPYSGDALVCCQFGWSFAERMGSVCDVEWFRVVLGTGNGVGSRVLPGSSSAADRGRQDGSGESRTVATDDEGRSALARACFPDTHRASRREDGGSAVSLFATKTGGHPPLSRRLKMT